MNYYSRKYIIVLYQVFICFSFYLLDLPKQRMFELSDKSFSSSKSLNLTSKSQAGCIIIRSTKSNDY